MCRNRVFHGINADINRTSERNIRVGVGRVKYPSHMHMYLYTCSFTHGRIKTIKEKNFSRYKKFRSLNKLAYANYACLNRRNQCHCVQILAGNPANMTNYACQISLRTVEQLQNLYLNTGSRRM